jgi:hypothetical protein
MVVVDLSRKRCVGVFNVDGEECGPGGVCMLDMMFLAEMKTDAHSLTQI